MDEFDEDEDVQIDIDGVPFAAEQDFLDKYGKSFTLSYGENKEVVLTANEASRGGSSGHDRRSSAPYSMPAVPGRGARAAAVLPVHPQPLRRKDHVHRDC